MQEAGEEYIANEKTKTDMLYKLIGQYITQTNKLQEIQQELRKLHNLRPRYKADEPNHGELMMAFGNYKEQVYKCILQISEIEQQIVDTKELMQQFAPNQGKPCTIIYQGQQYLIGYIGLTSIKRNFVFVKKSERILDSKIPTYLPTYLPE